MSASFASPVATDSLVPGTELIVDRLVYRHHGIYLGDGLVIHYAGRTRYARGFIEAIPLQDFVGRRRVRLARKPTGSRSGEEIVRRACSRFGRTALRRLQEQLRTLLQLAAILGKPQRASRPDLATHSTDAVRRAPLVG